ncbi:hypothetical protein C8R43DRAFT_1238885 [Mycena crocata]|nr:hypothetical protein C8R43DRAFT_1238885 [Mycena crocata]
MLMLASALPKIAATALVALALGLAITTPATATPTATAAAHPTGKPAVGTVFAVYPGWDMDNGGALIPVSSEEGCLQACAASASCLGYAYAPYGIPPAGVPPSACYLKSSVNPDTFKAQPDRVTNVGIVGRCGTFTPIGPDPSICRTVTVSA